MSENPETAKSWTSEEKVEIPPMSAGPSEHDKQEKERPVMEKRDSLQRSLQTLVFRQQQRVRIIVRTMKRGQAPIISLTSNESGSRFSWIHTSTKKIQITSVEL